VAYSCNVILSVREVISREGDILDGKEGDVFHGFREGDIISRESNIISREGNIISQEEDIVQ
jgi:hypothetical protein